MKFGISLTRALVGAAILLGQQAVMAQTPKDSFVIGGVVPLSGAYALLGTSMQKGVDLAVEQRGKVLGKPVKALWEDSETKPQTSVQKANKLLAGGVSVLFGDGASGQTLAIMPVTSARCRSSSPPPLRTRSPARPATNTPFARPTWPSWKRVWLQSTSRRRV